ncbi:hypothetical protein HMPREF1062_00861 [Bacteroides cellulosilyticus CL02T12C19]|uniref:Transposase IS4-like domain-containing protein n=1 Tax=Bacteroides cellulosilyticus CL02T12C19 TaxID=997874 RepID=I8WFL4_9BACE|nr:hypothetical protein HMPREF1062_00861 [Bacteroides cellulosilyticus CL02T12C19]
MDFTINRFSFADNVESRRRLHVKCNFQNCTIIGDRGYIGAAIQLDLFKFRK